jgi:hypothetical protein
VYILYWLTYQNLHTDDKVREEVNICLKVFEQFLYLRIEVFMKFKIYVVVYRVKWVVSGWLHFEKIYNILHLP